MLKYLVRQQKIEVLEREVIADHQIAFVTLKFFFEGDWKKFHKVVQFTQCEETYNQVLGTDGMSCLLPAELHAGTVKMSVFGYDAENTEGLRATTVPVTLRIRQSGFVGDGMDVIPPTPDLYAQLLQMLDEKSTSLKNGKDGHSAYEIAAANGFSGTEADWLESLKGKDGANGKDGKDGKDTPEIDMSGYATKDELQKLEENALYLENLIQSGATVNFITLFESEENALDTYGESIYTFYNDGFRSLAGFSESYPNFCSVENGYTIYFNQSDFGWASTVFVLSLTPISLTPNSHLILSYIVGATQETECYLVQKTDKSGAELAQYIYSEIAAGNAITIPFQWLYSDSYVSVMQSLETIESGEYYLAIQGTSDNSHPMIKSIKFLKG